MTNTLFLNELLNITETQKDGFKVLPYYEEDL